MGTGELGNADREESPAPGETPGNGDREMGNGNGEQGVGNEEWGVGTGRDPQELENGQWGVGTGNGKGPPGMGNGKGEGGVGSCPGRGLGAAPLLREWDRAGTGAIPPGIGVTSSGTRPDLAAASQPGDRACPGSENPSRHRGWIYPKSGNASRDRGQGLSQIWESIPGQELDPGLETPPGEPKSREFG